MRMFVVVRQGQRREEGGVGRQQKKNYVLVVYAVYLQREVSTADICIDFILPFMGSRVRRGGG